MCYETVLYETVYGLPPPRARAVAGPSFRRPIRELLGLLLPRLFRVPTRTLKEGVLRGRDSTDPLTEVTRLNLYDAQTGVPFFNAGVGPSALFVKRRFRR